MRKGPKRFPFFAISILFADYAWGAFFVAFQAALQDLEVVAGLPIARGFELAASLQGVPAPACERLAMIPGHNIRGHVSTAISTPILSAVDASNAPGC